MCLFLQNQRFQELTAKLINNMAAASRAANMSLVLIGAGLEEQKQQIAGTHQQLDRLQVRPCLLLFYCWFVATAHAMSMSQCVGCNCAPVLHANRLEFEMFGLDRFDARERRSA